MDAGLQALHENGFILRYSCRGAKYCQVLAWTKHQNPHCKEVESTIPAPCENRASTVLAPEITERAGLIPDSLIPDSSLSDSRIPIPPPSKSTVSILKENARAREARQTPKYDPAVGLAIDWRKWLKARDELELKLSHGWGSELTQEELFKHQCMLAGVTAEVGWQLAERALKMPLSETLEASA